MIVNDSVWPGLTVRRSAVFLMESDDLRGCTLTVARARSLCALGSGVGEVTTAVLRRRPVATGLMTILMLALWPLAIEPSLQTIGVCFEHEPPVTCADTILTGSENVSVTVGLEAVAGPWLVTLMV